jgi:methylenetetrahydrofolate--tRNA-(uracil-5-)-methyltransferase
LSNTTAIIGGGLAGCECAWQMARRGHSVRLFEMRPHRSSAAHSTDLLAELVCSNSLRGRSLENAVGLLKEEMSRLGSLVMDAAARSEVPAGGAQAVDRDAFAAIVTSAIDADPRIEVVRREVEDLDDPILEEAAAVVVATGPLTSDSLAASLSARGAAGRLFFYDAIAPVIEADSIDASRVFAASRYGKGGDDYLNCPFDEPAYQDFITALLDAETIPLHVPDEEPRFFQGCQPIEEIARQGRMSPAFGPMKPVGLPDPATGHRPFAVVQLRPENRQTTAYNLVGFQTRLRHPEQRRVFRTIPGLEEAVFLRLGSAHRNTYLDTPRLLDPHLRLPADPRLRFAGQITGVEGYVESAACGLLQGIFCAAELLGEPAEPPPPTTALGALHAHLRNGTLKDFQPSNIHWGHFLPLATPPPRPKRRMRRRELRSLRRCAMADRALEALAEWASSPAVTSPLASP